MISGSNAARKVGRDEGVSPAKAQTLDALRQVGVQAGDIVLVHCDASLAMKLTGAKQWGDALLFLKDCFQAALCENGTLVVPTFNYDFCLGKTYDHQKTPSQVGLFTNHIRLDPRAVRSLHPIFPFAAIGKQAHALCDHVSHSSFGINSVFDRLYHADAKLLFFNVPFMSTFIHYIEQWANVDYRYLKYFTGRVRIGDREYIDTFDFYVRYLERDVETFLAPLEEQLRHSGILRRVTLDGGDIVQVPCRDVYREAFRAMEGNPYALLKYPPKAMSTGPVACISGTGNTKECVEPGHEIKLIKIMEKIYPLHRTLVSEGTDEALDIIGQHLPKNLSYSVEVYEPTKRIWTWRIPERYVVHEAYLETEEGQKIVDFRDNPLHLVSYSVSIDKWMTWQELGPHLYYSTKRPHAIPWEFKYYERDWGFCLSKEQFEGLPRNKRYRAVIHSEFRTDPDRGLRVGVAVLHPEGGPSLKAGEMLVCAHICHPRQANDGLSGAVVAMEVLRRLSVQPLPKGCMSLRFLFCPETIGSICYLGHHEDLISRFRGGIFVEMVGNPNSIVLQHSRQHHHLIDRVAQYVLKQSGEELREGSFREVVGNDEMVINGPGLDIPCISISRWPYEEYHTSDDNLSIIHEDMLIKAADIVEEIIRIFASNYVPIRTFRGPVFLSGYGLWVDWRVNMELNHAMEKIMLCFEGQHSIFDIAEQLELEYWEVRDWVEQFRERGLVKVNSLLEN